MVDSLAAVDPGGLAGLRISLDPGHGGMFAGAVGVNGLTEKEVNLGVALKLRGLLESRGAQVFMTRDSDRDFVSPADSSLRADLAERMRLANGFHPDLFMSIHHNADAGGAHDVQETQTYYKLGDEGVSLDVAQDVHRSLVRNVGIERNRVQPGNYFVLRNSEAPGLLTETSYLTFPETEARLRTPEAQELEAEALLVGLARYRLRHVPVIESLALVDAGGRHGEGDTLRDEARVEAIVRGGFDQAELRVDGQTVTPARAESLLTWSPPGDVWRGGWHDVELRVRLTGVGAARPRTARFLTPNAGRQLELGWRTMPEPSDPIAAVRFALLERPGVVHTDTTFGAWRVRVRRTAGQGILPRDTTLVVRDGVAWGYFREAPGFHPHGVTFATTILAPRGPAKNGPAFTLSEVLPEGRRVRAARFVREMPADTVLRDAPGTREPDPDVTWLNRDGFALVPLDAAGRARAPALAGYRRWGPADTLPPRYVAIAGGVLRGHRIMIDPEGGGQDTLHNGPGGTRASFVNLETARILAGLLRVAGAEVAMTREGDLAVSDVERVQASEAFHAERFLRIAHRDGRPRLGYYFSSAGGKRWAQRTARAFTRFGAPEPLYGEDAQYVVQQVSAVAMSASPSSIVRDETRLAAPGALRDEAWMLFGGLLREWSDAEASVDSLELRDAAGAPVPGAAVTLGGALVVETDALGRARFLRTEPGPLEVTVDDPRARVRATLLESSHGSILTGCCGR